VSFILDALRKSESERQRDAVPSVTRVPLAAPKPRLPVWALTLMAGLGICVLLLTVTWWRSMQSSDLPGIDPDVATNVESSAAVARQQSDPTISPSLAADSVVPPRPATADETGPLPSIAELRRQNIAVPDLQLQLYSFAPGQRYAFINGTRYREGERLDEGLLLVSINEDGAVLSQQGREFLLRP